MTRQSRATTPLERIHAVAKSTKQTEALLRRRGADSLDFAVIDAKGREWNGVVPAQLRCRAIAVFPDGHEVIGDSDEYDAATLIYQTDGALWDQARERLVAQFLPRPVETDR